LFKKVLVIGTGFLGSHLTSEFEKRDMEVICTNYSKKVNQSEILDIKNISDVNQCFKKHEPELVINCAAYTNIDTIEKNPTIGYSVNFHGAENVAITASKLGIRLVHISTDSIFDGKKGMYLEEDQPNPINYYADSKLKGEQAVKNNCQDHVIVRTNFYGLDSESKFLFNKILNDLKLGKKIIGFSDVIFTPLEVSNLSQLIYDVATSKYNGILHLASDEIISKYDFCIKIAEVFKLNKNSIKKGSIDEMKFLAKRPKHTSLSNLKSKEIIKSPIISLVDWLKKQKNI